MASLEGLARDIVGMLDMVSQLCRRVTAGVCGSWQQFFYLCENYHTYGDILLILFNT